jgi:hypothetical protein
MATAKELRVLAMTLRVWARKIHDPGTAMRTLGLAAEMDGLAASIEVADRQLV